MTSVSDQAKHEWVRRTKEHMERVRVHLNVIRVHLLDRAYRHDESKLREPELSGYAAMQDDMRFIEYGTPEYQLLMQRNEEVVRQHYAANDHHPEHFPNGMHDMNLLQLLEMLADWKAASERTSNGSLVKSFEVKRRRLGDDPLLNALERTAKELGWLNE